jgi:hypothetical protein
LEEDIEEDSEEETADGEDADGEENGGSDDEMDEDLDEDISSLDPIIPDESPPRKKAKLTDDVYTEEDFDDFAVRLFYTCTFFFIWFLIEPVSGFLSKLAYLLSTTIRADGHHLQHLR